MTPRLSLPGPSVLPVPPRRTGLDWPQRLRRRCADRGPLHSWSAGIRPRWARRKSTPFVPES